MADSREESEAPAIKSDRSVMHVPLPAVLLILNGSDTQNC
jgi:hypothetical protein